MKAKLIINDKELEVEISEEELKKFVGKSNKTGYEKTNASHQYWYVNNMDEVAWSNDCSDTDDYARYNVSNYYADKSVATNNARADKLMRQLRRFVVEHRVETINYSTDTWYEIMYDCNFKQVRIEDASDCKYFGTIHFNTREVAQLAIDTFYDELMWYFTEYKDSL